MSYSSDQIEIIFNHWTQLCEMGPWGGGGGGGGLIRLSRFPGVYNHII